MANALYTNYQVLAMSTGLNLLTANIKAILVRTGAGHYVFNASDVYLSAVSSGDQIAKSSNFSGKSVTGGTFDAANIVFSAVPSGPAAGAIIIYQDNGADSSSILIEYRDSDTGMPCMPAGGDIDVNWDSSSPYIFEI